jgi:ribosomal protein S18 acetylase RimI-like enzyme
VTVTFRPALPDDYPAICTLVPTEDELFLVYPRGRFPLTAEQLRELAATRQALTVAVDGAQVIGFANLYDLVPNESAFIGNVVIAGDRRREGLGRRLVQHMLNIAGRDCHLPEVRISVFCHNAPALMLYAGLGFEPYALDVRRHPRGHDVPLLHMRRYATKTGNNQQS